MILPYFLKIKDINDILIKNFDVKIEEISSIFYNLKWGSAHT